jgi:hypothetical protein
MDNMLSATHQFRVSFRPTSPSDSDELPRKLTAIARFYTHLKRTLLPTSDQPGRSTKRRRLLTDMPREGNLSPSRRSPTPGKSSKGTSEKKSSVCDSGSLFLHGRPFPNRFCRALLERRQPVRLLVTGSRAETGVRDLRPLQWLPVLQVSRLGLRRALRLFPAVERLRFPRSEGFA